MLLAWRGAFAIELARDADQVAAAMADLLRARELAEPGAAIARHKGDRATAA